ncbi:hypothetical protein ONF83_004655 [Vibrio parahaemolyticus]|nr:hypothetical protein [Vibrio parahaemolyticus]
MSFTASDTAQVLVTNIQFCDLALATNAQLRGEARNHQAAAWHFNTKTNA